MKFYKFLNFMTNKITLAVLSVISAFTAFFFYSCRANYVFLDYNVFNGISYLLLSLMIINTLALLALFVCTAYNLKIKEKELKDSKAVKVISLICFVVCVIFLIGVLVNIIVAGAETTPVIMKMAARSFPAFIGISAVVFFVVFFPAMKNKILKTVTVCVTATCILIVSLWVLAPVCNYKITSAPMVIDSGEDYYSVVFATNDEGTGYVEYEFGGDTVRLYDEAMGRIKGDSKIHTVKVPKEELDGNTYRVGSKRVVEAYSYGSYTGKEVVSENYTFNAPDGENQQWLCVSDWHTYLDKAYDAVSYAGEYDGVIMLGDAAPGFMFEDEIKDYIVEFGGNLCKGEVPVVYIRGNHETRGEYAAKLPDYLGIKNFYYTASFGNYEFIVLDSGEDKEDSHPEYGGMVNYAQYRENMTQWLETLEKSDKKVVVLSHSYEICIEKDLSNRAYSALKNIGAEYIISGHTHTNEFFEYNGLNVYLDGGHGDGVYVASKITLSSDGILIEAWNDKGKTTFSQSSAL